MKHSPWFANRVLWGMVLFLALVGLWEFYWKPQYKPFYEEGVKQYSNADYLRALNSFGQAYAISPNSSDVILMMGWTNFKLRNWEQAQYYFDRALRLDPRTEEAQLGAALLAIQTGRGTVNERVVARLAKERGSEGDVKILTASLNSRNGQYLDAMALYRSLLDDPKYSKEAREALQQITGYDDPSAIPPELAPLPSSSAVQVRFRAGDAGLWIQQGSTWAPFYVNGINIGPGAPGFFPGAPPDQLKVYSKWLADAATANANVVRAYTLLPPAFYVAFRNRAAAGGKLALMQQIWVGDPPDSNLWDAKFVEQTQAEIRYVIDAIHGRGNVPPKYARGSGLYPNDVSANVAGLLLGREFEGSVVITTNKLNSGKTSYVGKFVSAPSASPSEVWLAEMLDYLVRYETETYRWQHPVAYVNWPTLDAIHHATEAPLEDQIAFRRKRGEKIAPPKGVPDDDDSVALDEAKLRFSAADFPAGLFASYHVYPYYPEFMTQDPGYLKTRDAQGRPDPYLGYLRDLRAHTPYPLVITEFGIPNSMGISRFNPYGWHHGGQTEAEQGEALVRMAADIHTAGCAGGVVFELLDEWYKHNWLTVTFEDPLDRAPLWLNELDPEKRYGLVGFNTSRSTLFAGNEGEWSRQAPLYEDKSAAAKGAIRSLQAGSDEAFLYLRLNIVCPDCRPGAAKADFGDGAYAVAINTLPGQAGVRALPFGKLKLGPGANFLLYLAAPDQGRLLVADDYNPYKVVPKEGVPGETDLVMRRGFSASLQDSGRFEELVVETRTERFARDGRRFPPQRYSRSLLRYGNGNPASADYDSLSQWYFDPAKSAVFVRIPWGLLLVTDPSSHQAWSGFDDELKPKTSYSSVLQLTAFQLARPGRSLDPAAATVLASFPAASEGAVGAPKFVAWAPWNSVNPTPYFKKAFYAIQKQFSEGGREAVRPAAVALPNRRASASGGGGARQH